MKGEPNRWWIYQRERFPILAHGPLILAFSLSSVCFSSLLRQDERFPALTPILVAFFCSFFSFLHLRLADEFKDFEEDSRFRPYRPVPRGLVTLRQLGGVWAATAGIQLLLTLALDWRLAAPLGITWIYLALMSREFFCRTWLKNHPFTYMWTHMLIMPLIDFFATACDWLPATGHPPAGLFWFVAASFFNGFIIEIGRKIRAPEDEENGVETYSFLWGRSRAAGAWWLAMGLTLICALFAAAQIHFLLPAALGLGMAFLFALLNGVRFLRDPKPGRGKSFELIAGIWTLLLYLILGVVPMAWRIFS
ncbi:MAG TPA: UbiA family prenyltransferase [Chthoniobacterales bacterium]